MKFKFDQSTGGILPDKNVEARGNDKDERFEYKPFKFIPNVRRMRVEVNLMDPLFASHGIKKRVGKAKLVVDKLSNEHLNRYIRHQLRRLRFCDDKLYWVIASSLIKRSNVFLTLALNHVFPKWSRQIGLSKVIRLATAVRRIAWTTEERIDSSRMYIPKSNGKLRPLGIPTPAWRIYLHMMNQMIVYFLETRNRFHPSQHGFRPSRGTHSAWTVILGEVIQSRDIYEFDLKNFFDSINLDYIRKIMLKKGIPKYIADRMYFLNTSMVAVKPPYKLNEFEQLMKGLLTKGTSKDIVEANPPISYMYRVRGVPQGSPTSPVLASLALENSILDRGMNTIMYADDGLYYGNIDQPVITPNSGIIESNIYFNLEKSGWVKRDHVWLKPLKFLGMEFDGVNWNSCTRKGAKLKMDKYDLITEIRRSRRDGFNDSGVATDHSTWLDLVHSKMISFVMSRMYSGSWELDTILQDFELTYSEDTFVAREKNDFLTIYNYSSYANKWLLKKLKKTLRNSSSWK